MHPHEALLNTLMDAHHRAAFRKNASSEAFCQAALGSGRYVNGLIGALSTLGGPHGPLEATAEFLLNPDVGKALEKGKIPGWGNSFVKGQPDPDWAEVHRVLGIARAPLADTINEVTDELHRRGKRVFPNPSCYTAATCLVIGMPPALAPMLFVRARLEAWGELFMNLHSQPERRG